LAADDDPDSRLPPFSPGLSHMSKEFVEELFAPSGELRFSGEGAGVWVGAQDVEGHTPDDGEVLRPIIFTGSGVVLVEDDVERPMQGVTLGPHADWPESTGGYTRARALRSAFMIADGHGPPPRLRNHHGR
jgi:hypothetical protein